MDGENKGKPYEQMDDLGLPLFLETPMCFFLNDFLGVWKFGNSWIQSLGLTIEAYLRILFVGYFHDILACI